MLALACALLFALAAVAALGAMASAVHANGADIASLSKRYGRAPRTLNVSWRICAGWPELRAASQAERPHAWMAPLPESLAA
jgi:hypothetical protein